MPVMSRGCNSLAKADDRVWWPVAAMESALGGGATPAGDPTGDPTPTVVGCIGGRTLRIGDRVRRVRFVLQHGGQVNPVTARTAKEPKVPPSAKRVWQFRAPAARPRTPWVATRYKLRGAGVCEVCGWEPPQKKLLHTHHVIPLCHGGTNDPENLVVLCPNHHAVAHSVSPRTRRAYLGPTTKASLLEKLGLPE